jgi:FkbM family methyltransferase
MLRYLFEKIYLPLTYFLAKIVKYRIKAAPYETLYHVDINYQDLGHDIFDQLIERIILDCKQQFQDTRWDFIDFISKYRQNNHHIQQVFDLLSDDESKTTYFNLIKFRLTYWFSRMAGTIKPSYQLQQPKYPIPKLHGDNKLVKQCLHATYFNSQYEIPDIVGVKEGETVIDAGPCYGDSTLYFNSAVQPSGIVYAFEPNRNIANILRQNIKNNRGNNITVVEQALSDNVSQAKLIDILSASHIMTDENISNNNNLIDIETTTLDHFIKENKILKIDFIKMDIEGFERKAIIGAEQTIKRDKPKLAISIYHSHEDMFYLPLLIHQINSNYHFYIRHTSHSWHETVLFCL